MLRGPPGTLYGRNTIGGAIKYVTPRMPSDPELRIRGTVGTYEQADLVVSASTPVTEDRRLRIGASFARLSRDGFGENLTTGRDNYNRDIWAGRLSAEYNNESNAFVRLQGDFTRDDSNQRGGHRLIPALALGTPVLDDVYDTRGGLLDPEQKVRAGGVSLYVEVQPWDGWTLRSISAYRRDRSNAPIDFDALPAVDVDVPAVYRNRQISQELQVLYGSGPFNALFGAYYLDADSDTIFDVRLPGGVTALTFGNVQTETFAVFGDFTYDFSDMFSVSIGGRYTWDQRTSDILRRTYLGGGSPFFGGNGVLFATTSDFDGTADFKEFTPRATVSFHPAENQTIYASYSAGFKGGGFDPRGQTTACRTPAGGAATRSKSTISSRSNRRRSTAMNWATAPRCSTGASTCLCRSSMPIIATCRCPARSAPRSTASRPSSASHQCRQGSLPGSGVRGQCHCCTRLRRDGDRLNFGWSLGYINADYLEFIDAAASTSPTGARSRTRRSGPRAAPSPMRRRWPAAG